MAVLKFANMAYIAACFVNDIKHIHTHAAGNEFFRLHELLDEYYSEASEQSDYLQELAMEFENALENTNDAALIIGWVSENQGSYTLVEGARQLRELFMTYYNALIDLSLSDVTPDVKNKLEEFMRYWAKEGNYKLRRLLDER